MLGLEFGHPRGKSKEKYESVQEIEGKMTAPLPLLLRPSPGIDTDHIVLTVTAQNPSTAKTLRMDISGNEDLFQGHADD